LLLDIKELRKYPRALRWDRISLF